jgi:hypothetical protein
LDGWDFAIFSEDYHRFFEKGVNFPEDYQHYQEYQYFRHTLVGERGDLAEIGGMMVGRGRAWWVSL